MNREKVMLRCIELAQNSLGNTYPNPVVGAVIIKNNQIIGESWHQKCGESHAEINAINAVKTKNSLTKSKIFVSLEPCSHTGKTPSCAKRLAQEKFQKVYIGTIDQNPLVSGNGIDLLSQANIEVESRILEKECKELNQRFFTFHQKKRPYIILKWAESEDGFLDKDFKTTNISNPLSRQFSHQLRAYEDAILVGTNTALNDNPSLTTREISGKNPKRIIIDFDLKIPETSNIYNSESETFIFNSQKEFHGNNLHFIKIDKSNFINRLLDKLYTLQIQSLIVEGGAFTLQQFIDFNFWDEIIVIKAKGVKLEKGTKAPKLNVKYQRTTLLRNDEIFFYTKNG